MIRPVTYALLAALGLWAVWDIVAVINGYPGTISRVVWDNSKVYPFIPFLAGLAIGHLFWPQYRGSSTAEVLDFSAFIIFAIVFIRSKFE